MPTPNNEDLCAWMAAVARASDREAFAALFRHFAPRVKSYLMRGGSTAELAEELAQETMVALWRRAVTYDPARAAVSTWVFTVARNLRIDHHRRRAGEAPLPAFAEDADCETARDADGEWAAGPDESAMASELQVHIRRAMEALPPEQALVVRLSFFEEHAHGRIAEQLGIPLGTVKSRIRIAIAQLRRTLERN
jgi:RNA polymerase sigma-70 factor (ECF subfamily)